MMRTLADLGQAMRPAGVQLASLGQRYQNYPVATFDERFGPYPTGPVTDQDALRLFLQQQMLGRDPEVVVPGSRSFPSGYIRSEGMSPMQFAENASRRANRPVLSEQQKSIAADMLDPAKWQAFMDAMAERDRKKAAEQQ